MKKRNEELASRKRAAGQRARKEVRVNTCACNYKRAHGAACTFTSRIPRNLRLSAILYEPPWIIYAWWIYRGKLFAVCWRNFRTPRMQETTYVLHSSRSMRKWGKEDETTSEIGHRPCRDQQAAAFIKRYVNLVRILFAEEEICRNALAPMNSRFGVIEFLSRPFFY